MPENVWHEPSCGRNVGATLLGHRAGVGGSYAAHWPKRHRTVVHSLSVPPSYLSLLALAVAAGNVLSVLGAAGSSGLVVDKEWRSVED
jgi:hypothetical protein